MHKISLNVEPMPCPRPRIAVRGRFPVAYYPAAYQNWKDAVARMLVEQWGDKPQLLCPLAVTIHVGATKPKTSVLSYPKADSDNYAKSVLDALTTAGVWADDCQVVNLEVFKRWSVIGHPYINIKIDPIT